MDDNRKAKVGVALLAIPALWLLVALLVSVGMAFPKNFSWQPEFNNEVHSHVENAYYASTPELMREELLLSIQGMRNLDLQPGDYSDMRPWKQTPNHRMDYQYAHMQAIIERAEDVIQWRESQGHSAQGSQQNDVYGQKMDAVRHFIKEDGWSDGLANDAFYVKHHSLYAAWYDYFGIAAISFAVVLLSCAIPGGILLYKAGDSGYSWRWPLPATTGPR